MNAKTHAGGGGTVHCIKSGRLHRNKRRAESERFTRSNRQPVYRFGYAVNM